MIESIDIEKVGKNRFLVVISLKNSDVTSGIYLTKGELYLFYTKIR